MLPWFRAGLLAVLATISSPIYGLETSPEQGRTYVQNFSARDFRGRPTLFAPALTPAGLVAYANFGSLVIYDGKSWQNIPVSDRPILSVYPARDGSYWLGLVEDFGRLVREPSGQWRFTSYAERLPADLRPVGQVWSIATEDQDVFFSTSRHIIRLRHGDPAQARAWAPTELSKLLDSPVHQNATVTPILTRVAGRLCWFQRGSGLLEYRGDDFVPVWKHIAELRDIQVSYVHGFADGALRLLKFDGTLLAYDTAGHAIPWPQPVKSLLGGSFIRAVAPMADGGMIITSHEAGIFWLDREGRLLRHITQQDGLDTNQIIGSTADTQGNLWLASQRGGARIELESQLTFFDPVNGTSTLGMEQIIRHAGRLYASAADGLYRLEPATSPGKSARWQHLDIGQENVRFFIPHGDELLLGTVAGLSRLKGDTIEPLARLPGQSVSHYFLPDGRLLLGFDNGVRLLALRDGKWETVFDVPGITGPVLSLTQGPAPHDVWIGTLAFGLFRLTLPPGAVQASEAKLRHYGPESGLTTATQNVMIEHLTTFDLIICPDGTFVYDRATDRIRPFDELRPGNRKFRNIEVITSTPDGRFFVQGVLVGSASDERTWGWFEPAGDGYRWHPLPTRYRERLGPTGATFTYFEGSPDNEVLWACGTDAVIRLDLSRPATRIAAPVTVIRAANRDGVSLTSFSGALPYSTAPVRFSFVSPTFLNQSGLRYQTRLLGYEDKWSPSDARTEVEFTNLTGGNYTFEVRALDADGQIGPVETFSFAVQPPWSSSWWAYALYALTLGAAVVGYIRWRLHAVRRERDRLERLVGERTIELREAKTRADAASAAKSTFLAHMSHELRTPLNGIIGYAQILRRSPALTTEDRARVDIVNSSGEHLLHMINEVLDFAKIEAGKLETHAAPFPLEQAIQEVANNLTLRAREKGLGFDVELRDIGPQLALGDAQKLRQVLENLLGNAVKFTSSGRVTLIAESVGDRTTFTVADTGVGIAPADLARLFEPFQQARENRPNVPGTGLGLAISRRLVALMGGELQVDSAPACGSRFWFTLNLPRLEAVALQSTPLKVTGYAGPRRRLLVIDDVAINRQLLSDLLAPLGFHVEQAPTGREGLEAAYALRPDLVFLDLRLPDLHGLEIARLLRRDPRTQHTALLAMSASVLSFNREEALAAGCDGFLPKPFREADLLQAMAAALGLVWEHKGSASPFSPAAPLDPDLAAALRELAESGDIAALREAVATARQTNPDDITLRQIETAAGSYQLERVRHLLHDAR